MNFKKERNLFFLCYNEIGDDMEITQNREYYRDFLTRSIYESNALENINVSYEKTYALLFQDVMPETDAEISVVDLKNAYTYSLDHLGEFDTGVILHLGEILNHDAGFRKIQNLVQGANFTPPAPEAIPSQLSEAIYQYNTSELTFPEKIATFHIMFERLHPYEDGNGRIGRIIINHLLLMNNLFPIVIPESRRDDYFKYIEEFDVESFSNFIIELQEIEKKRLKELV